jgi:flagellar biosynthetic protein FliP
MGTQQMPPNQVLIGLALFLTFFIMMPVGNQINEEAIQPYLAQEITQEQAIERAKVPLREFMLKHTRNKDLALFVSMSGNNPSETIDEIPTRVIVPAFIISELKTAFQIGFLLYVPFIIIDMVVASTLMSMGMMMLPPVMISLPFKILLFIMVDGWNLVVRTIISGFK